MSSTECRVPSFTADAGASVGWGAVGGGEGGVGEPALERGAVREALVEIGVVGEEVEDGLVEGFVHLDPGVLGVGLPDGVLIGGVGGDGGGELLGDDAADLIGVFPVDVAEEVVELADDGAEVVDFWLGFVGGGGGGGVDDAVGVGEGDGEGGLGFDAVTVDVDRLQDALGRSSSIGAGSLGMRKLRKIESFSQVGLVYGRMAARKA